MKRILNSFFICLTVMVAACKKDIHGPLTSDGATPGSVSNFSVENLPGAARITYTLPENEDVLYVQAEYERVDGQITKSKSSYYNNYVLLEGFRDSTEREVRVSVISKSGKQSAVETVKVKPRMSPIFLVRKSLQVNEDFGGLHFSYQNPVGTDVAIVTLSDTSGTYEPVNTYYSKLKTGTFSIRGFNAESRKFGFFVRDRWGNNSDTLSLTMTPIPEVRLDRSKFRQVILPGDVPAETAWGDMSIPRLWDGSKDGWDMWHSAPHDIPMWITMDLGVSTQLSRVVVWQRQDETRYMFSQNNVKKLELWGTNQPAADGSWDGWTKLVEHEVIKPSGLPIETNSAEDITAAQNGSEIIMPFHEPVRYIRVKVIEIFQKGGRQANIAEIAFFGKG